MAEMMTGSASGGVTDAGKVPKKRGPRTDSLAAVRRQLGRVYRDLLAYSPEGGLKPAEKIAKARALGDLLTRIGQTIRDGDVETRLAKLEDSLRLPGRAH